MEITFVRRHEQFKIYFGGKVHLYLKLTKLIGYQSWIFGESEYVIEYYFSNGTKIITEYGSKELFEKILDIIDKSITV